MLLIVDMNSTENPFGFQEFVSPIISISENLEKCTVKHYLEIDRADLKSFEKIILSGSALMNTSTLNQTERFNWIKDFTKPILGICAGMQTIGIVFGGHLKKCREIGMSKVETCEENILFSSTFKVYSLHNYGLIPSAEFNVLAESANCIQAIKHKNKKIFGVLFHPEVRNSKILQRFIQAC